MSEKSLQSVIDTIVPEIKPYVAPYLHDLFENASRCAAAEHAAAQFKSMRSEGRLPAAINSVKKPTLQVSQEFLNSSGSSTLNSIDTLTKKAQIELLDAFITIKEAEARFFRETYLSQAKVSTTWKGHVATARASLKLLFPQGLPQETEGLLKRADISSDIILGKVISLAQVKYANLTAKREKKQRSKQDADVDMVNQGIDTITIESAVQSVLRKRSQAQRDRKKASKTDRSRSTKRGRGGPSQKKQRSS